MIVSAKLVENIFDYCIWPVMRLKISFEERKINGSCWYFQPYGCNFLRFRDQNAEGENAEIAESFVSFITADTRQKTAPYPRMLWVQTRQIECDYDFFLVKMKRQKERRHKSSSSSSYSDPTEVSQLSWMGVAEFCSLHHCLLTG